MRYKVRKLSNLKRRNIFDTYEPKKRIEFSKEEAFPFVIRVGHKVVFFGGWIGFWASSILIGIKSCFSFRKKVERLRLNKKVVEFRIKKC
tara:strand:- start:20911 stop:21180 length:270 start_codon:yes stop_codon:yes gene_type:complete